MEGVGTAEPSSDMEAKLESSPSGAPEIRIYPVHMMDDTKPIRGLMMRWFFRVDAQLHAEKLRDALTRVLETGDWCKLAGRLHLTETGRLEVHVERPFSDQNPPFSYTHKDFTTEKFDDDEERRGIAKASQDGARIFSGNIRRLEPAFVRDSPITVKELLARNLPQLGLHVTSFADATMIALTWPHTMMDGTGQRELVAAWSLALAGREHEIRPLLGARRDVAWEIAGRETEEPLPPSVWEERALGFLGRLEFFARFAWRHLMRPRPEPGRLYLPKAIVNQWRKGVEQLPPDPDTGRPPFISDNDLIAAWAVRLAAAARPPGRSYVVIGATNVRARLPELRDAEGVYVQNLVSFYYARIPAEVVSGPSSSLAALALAHRREVAAQTAESQMIHHLRRLRAAAERSREPGLIVCCRADDVPVLCNNMSGLRIGAAVDFGPAVVPRPGGSRASGRVSSQYNMGIGGLAASIPYFTCIDQDDAGYWVQIGASPQAWQKIIQDTGAVEVQGCNANQIGRT